MGLPNVYVENKAISPIRGGIQVTSVLTRGAWLLLAPVAVAFLLIFAAQDISAQVAPGYFDPCGSVAVNTTATASPSDIAGNVGTGIGPDCIFRTPDDDRSRSNFGGLITFTPPEWGVASDAGVPDGTLVGTLVSDAVLGLFNNPCRTELFVTFDLFDATTDRSNPIDPLPSGTADRLSPLAEDADNNGNQDGIDRWPSYLDEVFEDVPTGFDTLHARLFGSNSNAVPGLTIVLNFMIFEPGSQIAAGFPLNIDPRLGYPTVTVLNDPTATSSNEDPINDFCAPLAVRTTAQGTVGNGIDFRTTPVADGVYQFVTFTASIPDQDGDGIENTLDPCPYTADPDWDPRGDLVQNPGDMDGDLLPDSCDPFPTEPSLGTCACGISLVDEDLDGWMNGADNCPLDSNLDQAMADPADGIGDACDQNPGVRDGELYFVCLVTTVTVGAGGEPTYNPQAVSPCDPSAPLPTDFVPPTNPIDDDPDDPQDSNGSTPPPGGATPTPKPGGGVGGGPDSGVGSLSPVGSSVPLWALVVVVVSTIGLLAGFGLTTQTIRGQRHDE